MMDASSPVSVPLISVVIPAFNAAAYLEKTLISVLRQSYRNIEVLVVDDGSEDQTCQIVEAIAAQDSRVQLLPQSNQGVAAARNLGIEAAQGEFTAPIDADDIWYPEAMTKLVAQFQASEDNLGVVYAWSLDIDAHEQPTGGFHVANCHGNVYKTLLCHNFLGNASSTLIRTSCLKQVGGYNTQFRRDKAQGCEDWDLYLRLAEQYEFRGVPEFLVGYRNIIGSMSGDFQQMARSQQSMLMAVEKKHPDFPHFLFQLSCSSFYLYLAHQSDARGQTTETLHWLKQSITTHVSPLIRLGFYVLLIKSLMQLSRPHRRRPPQSKANSSIHPEQFPLEFYPHIDRCHVPPQLPFKPAQVQLKLFVSMMLHQFLLRI